MIENLQVVKMVFNKLKNNPELFYKNVDPESEDKDVAGYQALLTENKPKAVAIVIFITFALVTNIAGVYLEKYNTCQRI